MQGKIYLRHRSFLLDRAGDMIYARVHLHGCNDLEPWWRDGDRGLLLLRLNLCEAAYDFSVGMMLAGGLLTGIIARRDS